MTRLKFCGSCSSLFEPKEWQVKHGHDRLCPDCTTSDPRWTAAYKRARASRHRMAAGRCEGCKKKHPRLECHHCDGDASNHRVENLRMLCPECHLKAGSELRSEQGGGSSDSRRPGKLHPAESAPIAMRLT